MVLKAQGVQLFIDYIINDICKDETHSQLTINGFEPGHQVTKDLLDLLDSEVLLGLQEMLDFQVQWD